MRKRASVRGLAERLLGRVIDTFKSIPARVSDYFDPVRGPWRCLPFIMGFLCAFGCSLSVACFLATSFDLSFSLLPLALTSALFSALFCIGYTTGFSFAVGFLGSVTAALLLAAHDAFPDSLRYVWAQIVGAYSTIFTDISSYEPELNGEVSATLALVIPAVLIAMLAASTAIEGGGVFGLLGAVLVFAVPCLIITVTPPDPLPAALMVVFVALLMLSRGYPGASGAEWSRWALALLPAVAALAAALWLCMPPDEYEHPQWTERLLTGFSVEGTDFIFQPSVELEYPDYGFWKPETESVDLAAAGPQGENGVTVMQLFAQTDSRMYMRAASLAQYMNNKWISFSDYYFIDNENQTYRLPDAAEKVYKIVVRTKDAQEVLFTPYPYAGMTDIGKPVKDSHIANPTGLLEYTEYYVATPPGAQPWDDEDYENFVLDNYTTLPNNVYERLKAILNEAGLVGLPPERCPQAVVDYLASVAEYDLTTSRVPKGEDFVLWFLEESRRGYCMHFASAGALLLRALGIPARYVTGYCTATVAGQWVDVTDDQAHAWVEYYVAGEGWHLLECTPYADEIAGLNVTTTPTQGSATTTVATTTVPSAPVSATDATGTSASDAPSTTTSTTVPSASDLPGEPSSEDAGQEHGSNAALLLLPLILLLAAEVIFIRRTRWLRKRRLEESADANTRALGAWRRIERLAKRAGEEPPARLYELALKARFSQHELTEAELGWMLGCERELAEQVRSGSRPLKVLVDRYLRLLY